MNLSVLWIIVMLCTRRLSASSFARVLRASLAENANDVLAIYNNKEKHADCARLCKSDCVSFTYDPETRECKTFAKMFCRNDAAAKSSTLMLFAKTDSELKNNPVDCSDVNPAVYCSGIYRITPTPGFSFEVYCDMDTANGPWTVIQNRQDGEVNFYRNWEEYKKGFGNLRGSFWLGNEAIHQLTLTESVLRIELVSWLGDTGYAQYSAFRVDNETDNYRLSVSGFSGNVTHDAMAYHNVKSFSTMDRDNDDHPGTECAVTYRGGWWYGSCHESNLNSGDYTNEGYGAKNIAWLQFYAGVGFSSMRKTRMLVKRLNP